MSFDDYIFVRPGFLRGVGKAIDIGGVISREGFVLSATGQEADARGLASDFRVASREVSEAFDAVAGDAEESAA